MNQQWWLGLLAGGTVFLGLPIARVRAVSAKTKALLTAISTGILIFLLVEITGHVLEQIEEMVKQAADLGTGLAPALRDGGLFAFGFSLGLLGLVCFERRYLSAAKDAPSARRSKQVAMMIAVGLGLHNFGEGLAIGQGYAGGALQLAWLLAIGFALHNATEGFGIAAPLSGQRVSWKFLSVAGLVAGGPTAIGALLGGWWSNKPAEIFCLALASGTILYVIGELLHLGRQLKEEPIVELGLLAGFFVAVVTDFLLIGALTHGTSARITREAGTSPYYVAEVGEHRPRHGGFFGDADDLYHYELLLDAPHQLRLYVNDSQNRPLNVRPLEGQWTLNPDRPDAVTGPFLPSIDGAYFLGQLPPVLSDPVHVEVAVLKGRLWAKMEFELPHPSAHSSNLLGTSPPHRSPSAPTAR